MKLLGRVKRCLIIGATIGLLMPQTGIAENLNTSSPIRDVALQSGGMLRGEVLSTQGRRVAETEVSLSANGRLIAKSFTAADGRFVVSGIQPGVYSVVTGDTHSVVRLWSGAAAPPIATSALLLIENQEQVVRGANGGWLPQLNHPFWAGGLLITAGVIGGVIGYNIKDAS